jgi:hypothetical protein
MDLQDFVSQTLTQIVSGVRAAQTEVRSMEADINPHLSSSSEQAGKLGFFWAGGRAVQVVQFEIDLTVVEGTGTKGGIGVFAAGIGFGSSGQSNSESHAVSRIKFAIPIALPLSEA